MALKRRIPTVLATLASTLVLALAGAVVFGCTSSNDAPATPADGSVQSTSCKDDARVVTYAPNMTKPSSGGSFVVRLVEGSPSPPARGMNDWTVKIEDASGAPMSVEALEVKTFMPLHGHTSPVLPVVATNPDGTFTVSKIYFMMPGLWEITFSVKNAKPGDTSVLAFCVEG